MDSNRDLLRNRWYDEAFYGHETIGEQLRAGAAAVPDTSMHFVGGPSPTSIRLGEMYARSLQVAGGLVDLGVGPGDVVAIWVPNWIEGALTYQAALLLGATVVPIVHIYGPREVGFILRESKARVLVMPDRWRTIDYQERFAASEGVTAVEHIVGLLIYTSGTTADPKGVQHTTNTLVAEIRSTAAALGERGGVNLAAFPAGHIAGAYGSSEHPVITTGTPGDPLDRRARTDGRLTPGNEIRLLDDDDREVGLGEDGEIISLGPELFVGYRDSALDADSFLPGGWFRTGDIGRLDADGYLTITDRKKDVIIRGGENIASKEVEDLLALHPAVADVAAVGKPDDRYGERVAVFLQLRPDASIDLAEVRRHFAALGVARQKTPEHIEFVTEFPRSLSGKVRKLELRARLRVVDRSA